MAYAAGIDIENLLWAGPVGVLAFVSIFYFTSKFYSASAQAAHR